MSKVQQTTGRYVKDIKYANKVVKHDRRLVFRSGILDWDNLASYVCLREYTKLPQGSGIVYITITPTCTQNADWHATEGSSRQKQAHERNQIACVFPVRTPLPCKRCGFWSWGWRMNAGKKWAHEEQWKEWEDTWPFGIDRTDAMKHKEKSLHRISRESNFHASNHHHWVSWTAQNV